MRAKTKTSTKSTKQKVKRARSKAAAPTSIPVRPQANGNNGHDQAAKLTPETLLQLQRSYGNAYVQRLIQNRGDHATLTSKLPSPTNGSSLHVQRAVMSSKSWMKESSKAFMKRSKELVAIDIALADYHKTHTKSPDEQLEKLRKLQSTILVWIQTKERDEEGKAKTRRKEAAKELNTSINSEMDKVKAKIGDEPDVSTAAGISEKAKQIYKGAESSTQAIMATVKADQAKVPMASLNANLTAIQDLFRTTYEKFGGSDEAAELNAVIIAEATVNAVQALQTLAEGYVKRNSSGPGELQSRKSFAQDQLGRIMALQAGLDPDAAGAGADNDLVEAILADVIKHNSFLKADEAGGEDFSTIEELLDTIDISTTMLGFQGTGGKGNEGFAEFYKPEEAGESEARSGTREAFSQLTPTDSGQADVISGVSDIENAAAGMEADAIAIYQAIRTLKNPNATKEEKLAAKFQVAKYPLSTVSNVMALTGGALTWHRGMGNDLAGSGFGFEHTTTDDSGNQVVDVDVSTDVKMAGDFAGLFTGIIDSIQKVVDLVKFIKAGGAVDAKTKVRTDRSKKDERRKDLEGLGNLLSKYTGTVASIANNTKSVIKLGYQIAGSGQNASEAATGVTGVANLGGVVPALGLIKAVMEAVRFGYRLARIAIRRSDLTDKIESVKLDAEFSVVDALEFARDSLDKRLVRLGINVAHAVAGIVAGGFNLSGIGAAPGMAIGLASSAMKLGQVGFRKVKQYSREKKAEKRKKKDEKRQQAFQSFEDWKNSKRMEAAKTGSRGKALLTWVDIKITRNWDKTAANKTERNRAVAMEILKLEDKDVYKSLGVFEDLQDNPDDYQKRLDIVIGALTKRD